MTIPTLHQSITEKVTTTQLKKTYSTFENALRMAVAENGPVSEWGMSASASGDGKHNIFLQTMSKYLRFTKFCGSGTGCFPDYAAKTLDGHNGDNFNSPGFSKALLADGSAIAVWVSLPSCPSSFCGEFSVDLNGNKPPNQSGKDTFWFFFYTDKVLPQGISQTGSGLAGCSLSESGEYNGRKCTAWVIYNGNMDYLHCNDLKWGGKTTCK